MGPGKYNRARLLEALGPGSYSRIARETGLSRSHVGRVLRGDAIGSDRVVAMISEVTGVRESYIRKYIREGGSPSNCLPAAGFKADGITKVDCPRSDVGPKWDPLRVLVLQLRPAKSLTEQSAVVVRLETAAEARSASECLHSGRRSRRNLLRNVDIKTSVRGAELLIHRTS